MSAQDDFARWAKLRRAHDKVFAEFQKSGTYTPVIIYYFPSKANFCLFLPDSGIRSARTSFDTTVASIRWVFTNGLRFFLQFWYAKQPLFWIPQGWVPGYVEWILAFPRAPTGSISIQVWGIACASVISLVSEALVALYSLASGKTASKEKRKEEPIPAAGTEKKEL